jgi:hypothetical protein
MPGLQIDLEVLNRQRFSTHLQQYQSTSDIDVVSNDNDDDLVSVSELFAKADPDPAPTAATATPPATGTHKRQISEALPPGERPNGPENYPRGTATTGFGEYLGGPRADTGAVNDTRKSGRVRKPKRYN